MYDNNCMVLLQICEQMTPPYKKNKNNSNFSFAVQEEHISVKDLHKSTHEASHFLFKCTECDYDTNQTSHLKRHINIVHKHQCSFKCPNCDYAASQSCNLTIHIKKVYKCLRLFKCTECNISTNHAHDMKGLFFVPSVLIFLYVLQSSVSLFYFILALPMWKFF